MNEYPSQELLHLPIRERMIVESLIHYANDEATDSETYDQDGVHCVGEEGVKALLLANAVRNQAGPLEQTHWSKDIVLKALQLYAKETHFQKQEYKNELTALTEAIAEFSRDNQNVLDNRFLEKLLNHCC